MMSISEAEPKNTITTERKYVLGLLEIYLGRLLFSCNYDSLYTCWLPIRT